MAMATTHSAVPIVANAQQQPHADPFACWSLTGPMMSLGRQSTAAGGCKCSYRYGAGLCFSAFTLRDTGRYCCFLCDQCRTVHVLDLC